MLPQLVQYPSNGLYILFAFILVVDEDIIEVHYHKNVEFFYQNLVDIALKYARCIGQSKKYHLILKMAIVGPEGCFSFILFPNLHLMVDIG